MHLGPFRYALMAALFTAAAAFAGCRLLDEDLSECNEEFQVDYELSLSTDITAELETDLYLERDAEMRGLLEDYLGGIYAAYAREVDLSFYDVQPPQNRLAHMVETINDSQTSIALRLPAQDYRHTAVANNVSAGSVTLEGGETCGTERLLQQTEDDTAPPHEAGIFTARADLDVEEGVEQHFDVHLYMVNSATALVLDQDNVPDVLSLTVFLDGMASGFSVSDSTFLFETNALVRTRKILSADSKRVCYASVHFPSADSALPLKAEGSSQPIWRWRCYATLKNGTVTETVISSYESLPAGKLRVVKGVINDDGSIGSFDPTVGVSVTLDWRSGGGFIVPI